MKKIVFLFASLIIAVASFAQTKTQSDAQSAAGSELSFGVEGGIPLGNFGKGWNVGLGGSIKYAYNVNQTFALTLGSGYMTFLEKKFSYYQVYPLDFIPIKAGFRYTLNGGIFYLEPQLGVSDVFYSGISSMDFTYAINVGYRMVPGIDVSARYEAISRTGTVSFIGFRFAYDFKLGKK